jgi:hypothetical protein
MAELNTDAARRAARTALGYSQAFDGKGIDWHSVDPWPHRIELAQALDWITELGAMVLNLADRADATDESDLQDMLRWAYSKLHHAGYSKQEDALMLDRMKLLLEHGA